MSKRQSIPLCFSVTVCISSQKKNLFINQSRFAKSPQCFQFLLFRIIDCLEVFSIPLNICQQDGPSCHTAGSGGAPRPAAGINPRDVIMYYLCIQRYRDRESHINTYLFIFRIILIHYVHSRQGTLCLLERGGCILQLCNKYGTPPPWMSVSLLAVRRRSGVALPRRVRTRRDLLYTDNCMLCLYPGLCLQICYL